MSSPTVSTEALLVTIMIDAYKRRDVATADIVGAYLNAARIGQEKLDKELANATTEVPNFEPADPLSEDEQVLQLMDIFKEMEITDACNILGDKSKLL